MLIHSQFLLRPDKGLISVVGCFLLASFSLFALCARLAAAVDGWLQANQANVCVGGGRLVPRVSLTGAGRCPFTGLVCLGFFSVFPRFS